MSDSPYEILEELNRETKIASNKCEIHWVYTNRGDGCFYKTTRSNALNLIRTPNFGRQGWLVVATKVQDLEH